MSEELKPCPCPFCGGIPRIREFVGATEIHCCNKCPARPKIRIQSDDIRAPTYEKAIAAWNRRASLTPEGGGERDAAESQMRGALDTLGQALGHGAQRDPRIVSAWSGVLAAWAALLSSPRVEGLDKMDDRLAPVLAPNGGMMIMGPDGCYWPFPLNGWAQQRWAAWCQKVHRALSPPVVKDTK